MKKRQIAWICVILMILGLVSCGEKQSLEEWEAEELEKLHSIAAYRFYDVNGRSFQLGDADVRNRPIVLHLWTTRSPASTTGLAAFEEAYQEYGDQVLFLMVNVFDGEADTMEDAIQHIEQKGYTFPVCYDRDQEMKSMNFTEFPYTIYMKTGLEPVHIRNTQTTAEEIGALIEDIL